MRYFPIILAAGATVGLLTPREDTLAASQEIVAFVSLLMAGLLPAMILTATVLRGDRFSPSRVREYGAALRTQLDFWAVLFLAAIVSVFCITAAEIVGRVTLNPVRFVGYDWHPTEVICRILIGFGFAALALILARLWPAYRGLRSVLQLSVRMAELQALANDRSLHDALDKKADAPFEAPTPVEWPREDRKTATSTDPRLDPNSTKR